MSQVQSAAVARPTKKPRRGEFHRLHLILSAEMLEMVDRFAAEASASEPWTTRKTRTEAIRILLYEGLRKRGILK